MEAEQRHLPVNLRMPEKEDGKDIYALVNKSRTLDVNSEYAYLLLGAHFQQSCAVAEVGSRLVGFVSAYIPPHQPDVLFVWQVVVDREYQKRGLALVLIKDILSRSYCAHVQYVQATITLSNSASRSLFISLSRDLDAGFHEESMFPAEYFSESHEAEPLVIIGPFTYLSQKGNRMHSTKTGLSHILESNVKSYVRCFPFVATSAKGATITAEEGTKYLDFLSGAGTLNYGHNNDYFKQAIISYIEEDGIVHGLDMATTAKNRFIETFSNIILKPRVLDYRLQFCGPTGTNSVEAAIKLARKVTGRANIISFTNGFHGMTLGALAVTGNNYYKEGIPCTYSQYTTFMPYCDYSDNVDDSIGYIRLYLTDNSSGVNLPAAIILECIQGEGGVNVASPRWLRGIRKLCDDFEILLIVDDIQMGCGRTGDFFSFEESGVVPDIVLLSKSIGAYGLPMALVLLKPELDVWKPGQHNGTFRGHNLAFVAATEALDHYWKTEAFSNEIKRKSKLIEDRLQKIAKTYPELDFDVRGRGFIWALESTKDDTLTDKVQKICFEHKLIVETCGGKGQVLKLLPPLTITDEELTQGLDIIDAAYAKAVAEINFELNVVGLVASNKKERL